MQRCHYRWSLACKKTRKELQDLRTMVLDSLGAGRSGVDHLTNFQWRLEELEMTFLHSSRADRDEAVALQELLLAVRGMVSMYRCTAIQIRKRTVDQRWIQDCLA
jgi:hypothetical protein